MTELKNIRSVSVHRGGGLILSADFATLEVKVFAAICQDKKLIEVLNSGKDLHCHTARAIFPELAGLSDKEIKEHHSGLRSKAKACLVAETKILLSDGSIKNIEDLSCNDKLLSRDEITNNLIVSNIVKVAETNRVTHLIRLELKNGWSLKCTQDHLIRLKSGVYKEAKDLINSDEIDTIDSSIKEVKHIYLDSPIPVYDIEVSNSSNSHNFCANGIFVHNCIFGLLYGKSTYNFSIDWGCSVEEAQQVIDGLMGAYPAIKEYVEDRHQFAIKNGYVENVFGLKRPLPGAQLPSYGPTKRQFRHAMNAAQNHNIQSSSSTMAWIGGTHVQEEFLLQKMKSVMIGGVHDSTYVDVYPHELVKAMKIFDFHACKVANKIHDWLNGVYLKLDFGIGQSWGRELDVKSWELKDGKCIFTLKGGNVNWHYLKRELDEAYDYEILSIEDGDDIPPNEREDIPIELSDKYQTVVLSFKDDCPNLEYKSKYYVGNGYFGPRNDTRENPIVNAE